MLKTLRLSFALKNTYRVNSVLYAIKQIPLIKKIIPSTVYQMRGFKILGNIISIIWEIGSIFVGKLLYFLIMIVGAAALIGIPEEAEPKMFLHLLLLLTFIGAMMNSFMFNPTKDKYYAMILLGMDAREYTLINYAYSIIKCVVGFTLCAFLFGLTMGLSIWQCLLVPFFVVGAKISFAAYDLREYERKSTVTNENKLSKMDWLIVAVALAAAYGLPILGVMIPEAVSAVLMCGCIMIGAISVRKILTFKSYRAMYQELLTEALSFQMDRKAQAKLIQEQTHKTISADTSISSNKKGFEYLNELFIKRHQKILWKSVNKISLVSLAIIAALLIVFYFAPEIKASINEMMMTSLPYFVFVMYLINRGIDFTRALFVNCDHSLLTYSFYKKPKFILKLFWIRLREIIKVNLLPATVIGAGLALWLFTSGGTENPLNYAVLFVSVVALSIFFSVHYLMLYYLLQPYNAGTEIKSGTYQFMIWATYIVCYIMIQVEMPTLIFGIMTIVFSLVYSIVASVLVYKLSPKTFKIRN